MMCKKTSTIVSLLFSFEFIRVFTLLNTLSAALSSHFCNMLPCEKINHCNNGNAIRSRTQRKACTPILDGYPCNYMQLHNVPTARAVWSFNISGCNLMARGRMEPDIALSGHTKEYGVLSARPFWKGIAQHTGEAELR